MRFLKKNNLFFLGLFMSVVLTGCSSDGSFTGTSNVPAISGEGTESYFEVTEEDGRTEPLENVKTILLDELSDDLHITEGGDYILSGEFEHTVFVDTKEQPVHIFLDNVNITSENGNAIYIDSASKVIISSNPGTENHVTDSVYYRDSTEYACIYSGADLTLNGEGKLIITGLNDDGVHTKDILKIVGTTLEVQAKGSALKGNDGICVKDSNARLEAEKNGVVTSKNGNNNKGSIQFEGSDMSVIAGKYAIISRNNVWVNGGHYYLKGVLGTKDIYGTYTVDNGAVIDE